MDAVAKYALNILHTRARVKVIRSVQLLLSLNIGKDRQVIKTW